MSYILNIMKKILFIFLGISFIATAQNPTTIARPIANGCGPEGNELLHELGSASAAIEGAIRGDGYKAQQEYCNQHDRDYYNGKDKKQADSDLRKNSSINGRVVQTFEGSSNKAYQNAQRARETSRQLQPTWEKENQQCLDASNYKVQQTVTW